MKSVGPELGWKVGTTQNGMKGILDRTMGPFPRTILVGGITASWFKVVPSILEEAPDIGAVSKLATQVHANVLVGYIFATAMHG